ncbi:cupredoxin domain-containing protein [Jatrophihabitans fulvus]
MSARRVLTACGAAVLALTAVAGCGHDQAPAATGPYTGTGTATGPADAQRLVVTTGSDYRFHPSTLVVRPGRVTIVLKNTAKTGAPHNLSVNGLPGAFVPLAGAQGTTSATFDTPEPGRYRFVCTIHIQQGQTGTLVVTR